MSYRQKPILHGTIKDAGENGGAIFGATVLNGELFVLGYKNKLVKVHDAIVPFQFKRQWEIPDLLCPGDIKTLSQKNALLVVDWTETGKSKQMHINDGTSSKTWSMEDDFGRLSISDETIVMSFHDQNALTEFTIDGKMLRKIHISPGQGIIDLQHAIKLNDNRFLLSHGDPKDKLHRVCLVDGKGKLLKSFGGDKGPGADQLDVPVYLELDKTGSVLVLDKFNGRVRLLSSELEFQKDLVTREDGLRFPVKMNFDEYRGLLYVADNDRIDKKMTDGRVLIYKITDDA